MDAVEVKLVDTDDLLRKFKTTFNLNVGRDDLLGNEKWGWIHVAIDSSSTKMNGFSIAGIAMSTWKGPTLCLDQIEAPTAQIAKQLYDATVDFGKKCNLTLVRFFSPYPLNFDWTQFGLEFLDLEHVMELNPAKIQALLDKKVTIKGEYFIRDAVPEDCDQINKLSTDLAIYEKMPNDNWMTGDILRELLFNKQNKVNTALKSTHAICKYGVTCDAAGTIIGYFCYIPHYSKKHGRYVYLEDLYVDEAHRGKGLGTTMMQRVAKWAVENRCGAYRWSCLGWNKPSLKFYYSIGAENLMMTDQVRMFRENYGPVKDNDRTAFNKMMLE